MVISSSGSLKVIPSMLATAPGEMGEGRSALRQFTSVIVYGVPKPTTTRHFPLLIGQRQLTCLNSMWRDMIMPSARAYTSPSPFFLRCCSIAIN